MMDFRAFVQSYPGGRSALAKALNVTEECVRTWETGTRTPRSKRIHALMKLSKGKLALDSFPGANGAA